MEVGNIMATTSAERLYEGPREYQELLRTSEAVREEAIEDFVLHFNGHPEPQAGCYPCDHCYEESMIYAHGEEGFTLYEVWCASDYAEEND